METLLDWIKARADIANLERLVAELNGEITIAKADTLPALDAAVIETKAEYDRFSHANTHIPYKQRDEAKAAWTAANQAAYEFRRLISGAEAMLKECAPISDIANLEKLMTELNDEIDRNTRQEQWWRYHDFAYFFLTHPLRLQSLINKLSKD